MEAQPIGNTWRHTYEIWVAALNEAYRDVVAAAAALVPNLIGAALLLLGGWLVALALRALILRLGTGLDRLLHTARARTGQSELPLRWQASRIVAHVAFWLVILFFVSVAASVLGLPGVADVFRQILVYLPMLLLLAAGLFVVYALSGLVSEAVARASHARGWDNPVLLGRIVRGFILTLAAIIAVGEIGLDVTLLVNVATLLVAALVGGAALAFGIGAGGAVGNVIASHYLRRTYRIGQRIRIDGTEGEILELTSNAVVVDGLDGRVLVPARRFLEAASVLLEDSPR